MIVGDLPDRLKYDYLGRTFTPFTGCMRNIIINGQLLDFSEPLEEEGVVGGCGFTDPHCNPTPCKNGGECTGTWSSSACDCTPFFKGSTCIDGERRPEPLPVSVIPLASVPHKFSLPFCLVHWRRIHSISGQDYIFLKETASQAGQCL